MQHPQNDAKHDQHGSSWVPFSCYFQHFWGFVLHVVFWFENGLPVVMFSFFLFRRSLFGGYWVTFLVASPHLIPPPHPPHPLPHPNPAQPSPNHPTSLASSAPPSPQWGVMVVGGCVGWRWGWGGGNGCGEVGKGCGGDGIRRSACFGLPHMRCVHTFAERN